MLTRGDGRGVPAPNKHLHLVGAKFCNLAIPLRRDAFIRQPPPRLRLDLKGIRLGAVGGSDDAVVRILGSRHAAGPLCGIVDEPSQFLRFEHFRRAAGVQQDGCRRNPQSAIEMKRLALSRAICSSRADGAGTSAGVQAGAGGRGADPILAVFCW